MSNDKDQKPGTVGDNQDVEDTSLPTPTTTVPEDDEPMDDGLWPDEIREAVAAEDAKHPIAQQGEDFQPDAMPDFDDRINSGEFKDLSTEQIREIYRQEEIDRVIQEEDDQRMQDQIDREEFDNDPDNDSDDD